MPDPELVLRSAYNTFNVRDIDAALELMHPEVDWPMLGGARAHTRQNQQRRIFRALCCACSHVFRLTCPDTQERTLARKGGCALIGLTHV